MKKVEIENLIDRCSLKLSEKLLKEKIAALNEIKASHIKNIDCPPLKRTYTYRDSKKYFGCYTG